MSTSDAAESELRGGGGERATPPSRTARAAPVRALHNETRESFQQHNSHGDDIPVGQGGHLSAIRQEGTHKALTFGPDRQKQEEKAAHFGDSEVHIQNPASPRFTSCLVLTLSSNQNLNKAERKLKNLTESQRTEIGDNKSQISHQASPCDHPISETVSRQTKKEEDVATVICNELGTTRDREVNDLHRIPRGSHPRRNSSASVALEEDLKNFINLENHKTFKEPSSPIGTMLSSSVVTVLAPHWSNKLRRTKRFDGGSTSDAQGNLAGVTNTAANCAQDGFQEVRNQHHMDWVLTDRLQAHQRSPFVCTRRNTVGWSSKSGPASLDYETKRKMLQTISVDVNVGKMNNNKVDAGGLSPLNTAALPLSPLSLNNPNEQWRSPQTGNHRAPLASSSKPTTSSMLLSLRRDNSNGRGCNATATFTNNVQDTLKSLPAASSVPYRETKTGPALSLSSLDHRERKISEKHFLPPSSISKEDTQVTQQMQTRARTQASGPFSEHSFLSRGLSERQHINTSLFSDNPVSLTRKSTSDPSVLVKTAALPRTTLMTEPWRKQVTEEDTSLLPTKDTSNKEKSNTPLDPPCNPTNLASPRPTDNTNTAESLCKGSVNLAVQAQGSPYKLTQRNPPEHALDRLVKQRNGSNLHREPREPRGLPSALSNSKISTTTAQTLSQPKDLNKHDVTKCSSAENVTVPPTLLNPKSSNTPTESSSKLNNNHGSSRFNSIPTFPHKNNSEGFTKQSFPHVNSKTSSGLPLSPNPKASSTFYSHPVSTQTNANTTSLAGSFSHTPKYTKTADATPIGFERSYVSIPKSFHSKAVSSLISTVSASCKTALPSPTLIPPPISPARSSPSTISNNISPLLTPPTTPVITSHSYLETSSPKEAKTFSSSPKTDQKKPLAEGKKVRRVTWEDSVDLQQSGANTEVKPDPSPGPSNPLSPSRTPQSVRTTSIFSFLRSNSPTLNTPPLCSPSPKTSSIQVGGGKFRSLSSDSADLKSRERERSKQRVSENRTFDQGRQDFTPRQERTQSVESATVQCRSAAPLSLPPDFSSGYKLRYSSPPYSSLMSSRPAKGESKTIMPRSPLFPQESQSVYAPPTDPATVTTSKASLLPVIPPQTLSLPLQKKTVMQDMTSSKCGVQGTDQVNNTHCKTSSQDDQNHKILLVDNRVHISSQPQHGDKAYSSSSTCVTETLVYSVKSKVGTAPLAPESTTPKALQHSANGTVSMATSISQQLHTVHKKQEAGKPHSCSNQSSSESSSTDSQSWDEGGCKSKVKVLGKSRFFSVESTNEQSPKRGLFALKKSVSTPTPSLFRSDSERINKPNNKMDQMFNRLKQTFSNKRASQTPSVSGSSDVSSASDVTVERTPEERQQVGNTEETSKWTQNQCPVMPPSAARIIMPRNPFSVELAQKTDKNEQNACSEHKPDGKTQIHLTVNNPTCQQFDFYKDNGKDPKPSSQFVFCRDTSPGSSPDPSSGYPIQLRKSASSPRSPFSPFASLSPLSPFSSPDVTDDSVFYSPKLARRRESPSPCEPGEGFILGASRRSRASTGPPSASPVQDEADMASSYADLKYGIEPGRSFSVSSVLSSRPSGPGRISTGSRFMSVGDLSASALTCGRNLKDLDQWSFTPDWTTERDFNPTGEVPGSCLPIDPGKMRSRSLPRSLTRRLANWTSGVPISQSVSNTASKPACLRSPNMNICAFAWDTGGPPTPPPTPPLSPASRPMSHTSSISSPTFSSSPGALQHADRGHLPSRGYVSSLSTFEESSDSSSDTTTDDEYYLETGVDEEKETEL